MATWTDIPDEVLEPGKPIRSVDALALRDNPIAIAQGAAGAPKVTENAMSVNSIHGNRLRSGTVTNTQIANMNAGKLNSGTIPGARIPTGNGGVGTYAFVTRGGSNGQTDWGQTVSGGVLRPASVRDNGSIITSNNALSGTWRIMGDMVRRAGSTSFDNWATLAVRIA